MKKIISIVILICISSNALADCDWTKIKENADGTYTYSKELNLCEGKLVQDTKIKDQQLQDLSKSVNLKDLALKDSDTRATNWSETSRQLEERLQKVDSSQKSSEYLSFGLGVFFTILSVYGASKLVHN